MESRGAPTVVIMPYTEYEKIRNSQRAGATNAGSRAASQSQEAGIGANRDSTAEEADKLAERFSREVIGGMDKEGTVQFEGEVQALLFLVSTLCPVSPYRLLQP